ncbi:MAG: hypothetical protein PPP58_06630 [Natronomonas sp.]
MSYQIDALGPATFDDGTSLLLTGSSTETNERLLDAVTSESEEHVIVITTDLGAGQVVSELERRGVGRNRLGIIDCTNSDEGVDGVDVKHLSSPGDLTGISLEFAKLTENIPDGDPVRVGFASISTVLMYAEVQTVFRFLHVFTARIGSAEMLGVFTVNSGMHEEQDINTIRAVFDCEAELEDDETTLRGVGFEQV